MFVFKLTLNCQKKYDKIMIKSRETIDISFVSDKISTNIKNWHLQCRYRYIHLISAIYWPTCITWHDHFRYHITVILMYTNIHHYHRVHTFWCILGVKRISSHYPFTPEYTINNNNVLHVSQILTNVSYILDVSCKMLMPNNPTAGKTTVSVQWQYYTYRRDSLRFKKGR